ncbi:hypothetical protein SCP_0109440 [Sparassis crispa]|uniref:Uncharacterized protein n=1 Tax=Sparassis crispa TaxID=139825 RepID=A0A401G7C1_9APHY|nr:hypothetical protein SCP_0109440 [Sparassis crispa]GBE78062.1 hypothetical protein SCP_0109440 [Sparassis crispa]
MDASIILRKYILAEALLHIEIFTEPFDPILWKAWVIRMHVLLVLMVQAQSEAASVGIILPRPRNIPVLAQVEIHLVTARTIEGGCQMIPQIADHLPDIIPRSLTARVLYDDPTVHKNFGLGHPPDGLPDIGTLSLRVETLRNAACELYDVMRGITSRHDVTHQKCLACEHVTTGEALDEEVT